MTTDQSLISLFFNASLLVKMVMLMLLAASIVSWTIIFQRWQAFRQARKINEEFEEAFWSGADLNKLYQKIAAQRGEESGAESIFVAGFKEFIRLRKQSAQSAAIMEGAQRAMRVAMSREIDRLEAQLPFLATVGSVSPYIGLFGTVWGIMNSFRALGAVQQASLQMVAPGISEALVATAMGLFAAIPAVVAYNRYANRLQALTNSYATFLEEFTSILHRQAYAHNIAINQAQGSQNLGQNAGHPLSQNQNIGQTAAASHPESQVHSQTESQIMAHMTNKNQDGPHYE